MHRIVVALVINFWFFGRILAWSTSLAHHLKSA